MRLVGSPARDATRLQDTLVRRLWWCWVGLSACAAHGGLSRAAPATSRSAPSPETQAERDTLALASLLPNEAARCVVASPGRVPEPIQALMGAVSQSDRLPWALDLPVSAYARAEVTTADERNVRVDYVRFASADAQRIREALGKADDRALTWGAAAPACAGELTCVAVAAEFIDARTVRLATGKLPEDFEFDVGDGRCVALLTELPGAIEVSARQGAGLFDSRELVGSEAALFVRARTIERIGRRHFLSPALAARGARKLATGVEDGVSFAGVPVRSTYAVRGAVLEQRSEQSFEELSFGVEDQARLTRALAAERSAEEGAIDPDESFERVAPERVLAHVEQALSRLSTTPSARESELRRLDRMLTRARAEAPNHEGLARKQFNLRCDLLGDGRAALEVADARLRAGGESARWQLARRAALARFDGPRLALALGRNYAMSSADAERAASELARQVQAGQDYERAEWALVTAHALSTRLRGERRVHSAELRLPLALLPRLFASWARLGRAAEGHDLGVHLVAFGQRAALTSSADPRLWAQDTKVHGRAASVFAAATWDDDALIAQGSALAQRFEPGALELWLDIEQLDGSGRGAVVSLQGRLEVGGELVIDELSSGLAQVRWEGVLRALVEPLKALRGSVFPPDELTLSVRSPSELEGVRRAAEASGDVACSSEGLDLVCRGGAGDVKAASRALLRTARVMLGADANALWSSGG